ncbi:MAG: T9SS type A sorting domain-containing protein [Bacteroidia bacterium]
MFKKLIVSILILNSGWVFAKKVIFSVDMTGLEISPNGVHISGDFQTEAGYPKDWDSKATELSKETGTNIYSIEVTIPAFRKYEYKFVNGDMFYEVEFVPEKSRVGYDFNDNRWIYIDSLSDEVTLLPVFLFGGNAPSGKKMVKFVVDVQNQFAVDGKGIHVAGSFQNWNTATSSFMYSFGNKVHEYVTYIDSVNITFKFLNGAEENKFETITGSCVNSGGRRNIKVTSDTVLSEVCFSSCSDCPASIFKTEKNVSFASLYPNPSMGLTKLKINNPTGEYVLSLLDISGRIVQKIKMDRGELSIETTGFKSGIYTLEILDSNLGKTNLKLAVN